LRVALSGRGPRHAHRPPLLRVPGRARAPGRRLTRDRAPRRPRARHPRRDPGRRPRHEAHPAAAAACPRHPPPAALGRPRPAGERRVRLWPAPHHFQLTNSGVASNPQQVGTRPSSIVNLTKIDVRVAEGASYSFSLTMDANLQPLIRTTISGSVLII